MASTTTLPALPADAALSALDEGEGELAALPEVLVVEAAGARVAIPVEAAREVLRLRGATRVPGAPAWVVGLLNVRGAVVVAGDLALLAGGAAASGPMVLVEADGRRAGLRVDAVIGVAEAELDTSPVPHGSVTRGGGLPSAGLARLSSEGAVRGTSAELPLLDVRAVLDDILEGDPAL